MRYRLMATWRGVPYEAGIGPAEHDVVLFAACPPPEELGFEPATGHWRKQLRRSDIGALWESRPTGSFRGERCLVLDDLGDRLHIAYLGHDSYRAEQLGYWEVERGVFEVIAPHEEVSDVVEERRDVTLPPAAADTWPGDPAEPAGAPAPPLPLPDPAPLPPASSPLLPSSSLSSPAAPYLPSGAPYPPSSAALYPPLSALPSAGGYPPSSPLPPLPLEEAARLATMTRSPAASAFTPAPAFTADGGPDSSGAPGGADRPGAAGSAPEWDWPGSGAGGADRAGDRIGEWDGPESARRRGTADRHLATQRIFAELAGLAAIPRSAFAVGEEVDGAMCLIQTAAGYEVFNSAAGSRHEVRVFEDEESAYFYLFGVLAAEAVRTGRLVPHGSGHTPAGHV